MFIIYCHFDHFCFLPFSFPSFRFQIKSFRFYTIFFLSFSLTFVNPLVRIFILPFIHSLIHSFFISYLSLLLLAIILPPTLKKLLSLANVAYFVFHPFTVSKPQMMSTQRMIPSCSRHVTWNIKDGCGIVRKQQRRIRRQLTR